MPERRDPRSDDPPGEDRKHERDGARGGPAAESAEDLSGRLLIAMPGMRDPRFERAVVLLCEHSDGGTMGLMVNKRSAEVSFPELARHLDVAVPEGGDHIPVHVGGPVEPGRGFVLHTADYAREGSTMRVSPRFGMTATVEVLREIAAGHGPQRALLALGYAGWAPGQLASEIAGNGWLTAEATAEIVFDLTPEEKWGAALAAIGADPVTLSAAAGRA